MKRIASSALPITSRASTWVSASPSRPIPIPRWPPDVCRAAQKAENVTHVRFVQDILQPNPLRLPPHSRCLHGDHRQGLLPTTRPRRSRHEPVPRLPAPPPPRRRRPRLTPVAASNTPSTRTPRRLPMTFRLCHWSQFHRTPPFDGSICSRCSYAAYNEALAGMVEEVRHGRFV